MWTVFYSKTAVKQRILFPHRPPFSRQLIATLGLDVWKHVSVSIQPTQMGPPH